VTLVEKITIVLLLALIAFVSVNADASDKWVFAIEVGPAAAYVDRDIGFDQSPLAIGRLRAERGPLIFELEHQSSIQHGPPFNNDPDYRSQNRVGVFYRWEW
jgi:hypothetical protein